jgi:hypothetical protein
MSLAIDTDDVQAVLLADGWHRVEVQSFDLDAYEYVWRDGVISSSGAMGFTFTDGDIGAIIRGPLQSVLAVRLAHEGAEED